MSPYIIAGGGVALLTIGFVMGCLWRWHIVRQANQIALDWKEEWLRSTSQCLKLLAERDRRLAPLKAANAKRKAEAEARRAAK